tara:strand:+ start:583 stop:909 length:327 start_codon:yes stop_codon:yes gene_type:complete
MVYQLVKGDTSPQIKATLTRSDDGSVVNCGGGTVVLKFRATGTTTVLFTLTAFDVGTNLADGIAIFAFSGTQLNLAEGYYEGEIQVTQSSGVIETSYKLLVFYVREDF